MIYYENMKRTKLWYKIIFKPVLNILKVMRRAASIYTCV